MTARRAASAVAPALPAPLLRAARRRSGFDPRLAERASSPRERAARRVRWALAQGRPVILQHPRWAAIRWFLVDTAIDLRIGRPACKGRVLDMSEVAVRQEQQAWARLLASIATTLRTDLPSAAAWPMAREGFRFGLVHLFDAASRHGTGRALLCCGVEHLGVSVMRDLCLAWQEHAAAQGPRAVRMLLAIREGMGDLPLDDAARVRLDDPDEDEAVELLGELLGTRDPHLLEAVVRRVGAVPGFLESVAHAGPEHRGTAGLGPMYEELLDALQIARTDERLDARLDALQGHPDGLAMDADADVALERAGLVRLVHTGRIGGGRRALLRSPLIEALRSSELA